MHQKLSPQIAAELAALPYNFIQKTPLTFDLVSRNLSKTFELNGEHFFRPFEVMR